jgi:drug/metabolite transporter (DMT)-like permease
MPNYAWVALAGALALSLASLVGKLVLRYRICDAGLVTWGQGLAAAVLAGGLCAAFRIPFPVVYALPIACLAVAIMLASWFLNLALQEGDASTVVPLMGLKIPLTSLLAYVWLAEEAHWTTWLAVLFSGLAVSLFGAGRQQPAQGGHGYHPVAAIVLVVVSCLLYAVSDIIAKKTMQGVSPLALLLWSNVLWAPVAGGALIHPYYRRYRVTLLDIGLFVLRGTLVLGAVFALYKAFQMAGGVIIPNVIYGTRGFFAMAAGFLLGRTLRLPFERQTGIIYSLRLMGALLLFGAVFLAVAG